jgi:hypothetical protein
VLKEHGLHFDFGIEKFVQAAFVSGMPYWHAEMPDQEMTDGLVQHVEEEPSAELENVKYYKIQKIQIIHECNTPIQE